GGGTGREQALRHSCMHSPSPTLPRKRGRERTEFAAHRTCAHGMIIRRNVDMFENFTRTEITTSGARIVTVHGGKGPPLLLMHGNPFSHLSWHKFAPRLAEE